MKDTVKTAGEAAKSPAELVGEIMLGRITESLGVSEEEAAMLLMDGGLPSAGETLSLRAAEALAKLAEEGGDPEAYLGDAEFLAALTRMPVSAAMELSDARRGAATAGEDAKSALMEQLLSRRSMPTPMRSQHTEGASRSYSGMSSAEFGALRERFRREAMNGKKPKF